MANLIITITPLSFIWSHVLFSILIDSYFILSRINGGDSAQLKSHVQFLKEIYNGGCSVGCARNTNICLDTVKNPNGWSSCNFNTFCKDLTSDMLHYKKCSHPCPYGLACCSSFCIDIKNYHMHCGNCFYECPKPEKCMYGMCGYWRMPTVLIIVSSTI